LKIKMNRKNWSVLGVGVLAAGFLISFQNCAPGFKALEPVKIEAASTGEDPSPTPSPTSTPTPSDSPTPTPTPIPPDMSPTPSPSPTPTPTATPGLLSPRQFKVGGSGRYQQISVGSHACVLLSDGNVKCFGNGFKGALGIGDNTNRTPGTAAPMLNVQNAKSIITSYLFTCALLESGKIMCAGGASGNTPTEILGLGPVSMLGLNPYGSTIFNVSQADGKVESVRIPEVTDPTNPSVTVSQKGSLPNVVDITKNYALTSDRILYAIVVRPVMSLNDVEEIASGRSHTCFRKKDSTVVCEGSNSGGQLGQGDLVARSGQVEVAGLKAKALFAGEEMTCALTLEDKLLCWGQFYDTQTYLDARYRTYLVPQEVPGLPSLVQVSIGGNSACGITKDDRIFCWGRTSYLNIAPYSAATPGNGPPIEVTGL
jgi:alpha-tubulin suppressor-like RCC1 family protein